MITIVLDNKKYKIQKYIDIHQFSSTGKFYKINKYINRFIKDACLSMGVIEVVDEPIINKDAVC